MKKSGLLPEGLELFLEVFEEDLSKPQFENLKSWTAGILEGKSSVYEIKEAFSEKHVTSLTRFMNNSPWDFKSLNKQRINWANNIITARYQKYYCVIIDDTVNRKYGSLLTGTGRYWSNSLKHTIHGQNLVTSHLFTCNTDLPLYVDIYQKKAAFDDISEFRSKNDMAISHIMMAPKFDDRVGVVLVDTWYSGNKVINTIIEREFEGVIALKKNRMVNFKGKKYSVSELAASKGNDFEETIVEGKVYQVRTLKVTMPGISNKLNGKPKKLSLIISQQKLGNENWSDFTYLLVTDRGMGVWTVLYLYRKRWKIETFYSFAKNAFDLAGSQIRSEIGALRYFTLLFFAYTYLSLSMYPHFAIVNDAKSLYQSQKIFENQTFENLVDWIHSQSLKGVDIDEIKLKLGF